MDSCPFFSKLLYFCHFLDSWFELEPVLDLSLVFFLASWTRSTLSFCRLASFVEKTSYSRFSFRYFISIQRCFGYKYTHYWLRSDFTSSSFTMPLLKLRCAGLFRLRNVVIESLVFLHSRKTSRLSSEVRVRDYKNLCDRQRTNKKHALLHQLSNISQNSKSCGLSIFL